LTSSFDSKELIEIDSAIEESPNLKIIKLKDINDIKQKDKETVYTVIPSEGKIILSNCRSIS
jgi:hypothetical protein